MALEADNTEKWIRKYRGCFDSYDNFRIKLHNLINDLILDQGISISQIESRTKTIESFSEKIRRKDKQYSNPVLEITDLCGIRIICYFLEDVGRIGTVLEKEFKIDIENSTDKTRITNPERFGYLSVHYVFSLSDSRKRLPEWKAFSEFKAELQVRTVLQHAWAAIDHKLRYKSAQEVPMELRRQLFRLSALLELADEEFSTIRMRTDDLERRYASQLQAGEYDIEVNLASLESYLQSAQVLTKWRDIAVGCGFRDGQLQLGQVEPERRRLLKVVQDSGISTIRDLNSLLEEAGENWGNEVLQGVRALSVQRGFVPLAIPHDVITILVIVGRREYLDKSSIAATFARPELQSAIYEILSREKP